MIPAVGNDGQFRKFCDSAGAPELADDPLFSTNAARLPHATGGTALGMARPIRLSCTPPRYELASPRLGQHTAAEVLRERLDLSNESLAALRAIGML
jgi:crotonobetainyl-CoA:carnitine CoA-transferase CaiB-like acyl-CoA transferase